MPVLQCHLVNDVTWGLAARCSKANKEARLVERKVCLSWMPAMWGGGGGWEGRLVSKGRHPPNPWARAFIGRGRGYRQRQHTQLWQSPWNWSCGGLISIFLIVLSTINLQFQGQFVPISFFYLLIYLFIYLFLAVLGLRFCARAFSSCGKRGLLFITVHEPLTVAASPIAEHRLQTRRLSNCGSRAQLLRGMWDLPRPGLEPMCSALAGSLSTTVPPGKPLFPYLWGQFSELWQLMSWLQSGHHVLNFFHLVGVSVSTGQLTGYGSEYHL